MPFLIDGNNLIFAMADVGRDVGRGGLCKLLTILSAKGQQVTVVFDGPPPGKPLARQMAVEGIETIYSGMIKADVLICAKIAENSAPRRLTVVSTDREIRQAARKRRCNGVRSDDFARALVEMQNPQTSPPTEPPEKRKGLTQGQAAHWLKEFGLD